jgi:hypothetical protein
MPLDRELAAYRARLPELQNPPAGLSRPGADRG